jgi:CBS domain-containing protein
VVVDEADRIEGLLTATDLVRIVRDGAAGPDATVAKFIRTEVITARPSAPVREVAEAMLEHLIHHVPVVDGDEPVGMITSFDLATRLGRSP